jgi:hypothetical protein
VEEAKDASSSAVLIKSKAVVTAINACVLQSAVFCAPCNICTISNNTPLQRAPGTAALAQLEAKSVSAPRSLYYNISQ